MKKSKYNSLGLDVEFSVPSTVEEFDQNAKKPGACLDEATNNIIYRGSLAEFRSIFLHGLSAEDIDDAMKAAGYKPIDGIEQTTKIARQTEPVNDASGKPKVVDGEPVTQYSESEAKYFNRVLAATKKEAKDFQALATQVAAMIPFDASATERKAAGPKKLADKHRETAKRLMVHKNLGKFLESYAKALPEAPLTLALDASKKAVNSPENVEKLGWAVQAYDRWEAAQQAKAREAKLLAD